jgi:manganese oxidase
MTFNASQTPTRRQLLKAGLILSAGAGTSAIALPWLTRKSGPIATPIQQGKVSSTNFSVDSTRFTPMTAVREFDYGTVTQENGRTVREFRVEAKSGEIQLNTATKFITWNLNDRVPGPTFRATEGDRIRVVFHNKAGHAHSLHFHGVHPSAMDGIKPVRNGQVFIYEFDAEPYGVHLYHCHVEPVTRHIGKGLYGMFIIDPPIARPPADELVLIMAGYDTNNDQKNEFYAFNGLPHYFMHHPIPIQQDQLIRLYVLNLIEFDVAATFHLHANLFRVNPTGRSMTTSYESDVITMGTAERHLLEFSFHHTGKFMFHPHQDYMAEAGCMGYFDVQANQAS